MKLQLITILLIHLITITICMSTRYDCDQRNVSCGCGFKNVDINEESNSSEEAIPHSWSMMVSIRYDCLQNGDPFTHCCVGTILNDQYILTAAGCFGSANNSSFPSDNITIAASIQSLSQTCQTIRVVEQWFIHPDWTPADEAMHNIALLRLAEPLDFKTDIILRQACFPSQLDTSAEIEDNTTLVAVGWSNFSHSSNNTTDRVLQQMVVHLIDYNDTRFCVEKDEGEVGTVLFQWIGNHWELAGIESYTTDGSPQSGLFVRVAPYTKWIESLINADSLTTPPDPTIAVKPLLTYECNRTIACGCGYSDVVFHPTPVVVGEDSIDSSWSMIVSLRFYGSEEHSCAGTLLSSSFVLTAAHCVNNFSSTDPVNITIDAGVTSRADPNIYQRHVTEIHIHPNYTDSPLFLNNIALVQIDSPLYFQNNPILAQTCVHRSNSSISSEEQHPKNGTPLVVIGWGAMRPGNFVRSDYLKQIQVYAMDNQDQICNDSISNNELQFCAGLYDGRQDACLGDSGGPILYWTGQYWEQVGIIGYNFHCEQPGYPGVYTRLSYYWQWMETILNTKREYLEPQNPSPFPTTTTSTRSTITRTTNTRRTTSTSDIVSSSVISTTRMVAPLSKRTYECNRSPDDCGCSLTNVVLSSDNQQLSSTTRSAEDAYPYSWSMIVSIQINGTKHSCTGTILSDSFILTAAHCVSNQSSNNEFTVAAGIHSLSQYITSTHRIDQVHIHENFTTEMPHLHDIAILHLEQPLEMKTQPIFSKTCLANTQSFDSAGITPLVSVGWKHLNVVENEQNTIQQATVKSMTNLNYTCSNSIYNDTYQFCAGLLTNDTCEESFGEPIFIYRENYWEQVGILSQTHGCVPTGHSGIYIRLSAYTKWIQRVLKNTTIPMRQPVRRNDAAKLQQNILILPMLLFTFKIFY